MWSSRVLASFIVGLFNLYEDLYFTYLEINPLGKRLGRRGHHTVTDVFLRPKICVEVVNKWKLGALKALPLDQRRVILM